MELKEFLARVLPQQGGDFFGATVDTNNQFNQSKLNSLDALASYIEKHNKQKHNIFFATGAYKDKREAKHTVFKKALYVDLDCGPAKPYATKRDAVRALAHLAKQLKLRPTIVVDSGNGIHGYWTLAAPIAMAEWVPLAQRLKELCGASGVKADTAVTADSARILRAPGTLNYKDPMNPKPARVIHSQPVDYTLDVLREALGQSGAPQALSGLGFADDLSANLPRGVVDDSPRYAGRIIEECQVMRHTYATGGADQAEPLWMQQLHLLAYAVDGDRYIHSISDGHEAYDHQRTEKKFADRLRQKANGIGPTLCKTLGMWLPSKCEACRWKGHISTPLQLGKDVTGELPYGYKQDATAIYKLEASVDDSGNSVQVPKRILGFTIHDLRYFAGGGAASPNQTDVGVVRLTRAVKGEKQEIEFEADKMARQTLDVELLKQGVFLQPEELIELRRLLVAWLEQVRALKQVATKVSRLGWTTEEFFATTTAVYKPDGSTDEVVISDRNIRLMYTPRGDRAVWVDMAHQLTKQNRHPITAAILSAFAAPLVRFTPVKGVLMSLVSKNSGTGKTTGLMLAQAVWGDPVRGMHSLQDTENAVLYKLGFLNTLPSYWDELRLRTEPEKFLNMIFQLGQGKERSRLTQHITMQGMGSWSTMFTVASNMSLLDHAEQTSVGSNAARLRIFELEVPGIAAVDSLPLNPNVLNANHGWIGEEYAKWLAGNREYVAKLVGSTYEKLRSGMRATEDERFWLATSTCLLVAGKLANAAGYTAVNLPVFNKWLVETFQDMRDSHAGAMHGGEHEDTRRGLDIATEYVNTFRDQFLVCDDLSGKGRQVGTTVIHVAPQQGEILGAIALGTSEVRFKLAPFRKWLYKNRRAPSQVVREVILDGGTKVRGSVTYGVANTLNIREYCLQFPLTGAVATDLIDPPPT